jgi:hypothetical protein
MSLSVPADPQSIMSPLLGAVPLGPDEPELFSEAMGRILHRLAQGSAGQSGQATCTDRLASPNQ